MEEEKERVVALGELLLSLIDDQYIAVLCTFALLYLLQSGRVQISATHFQQNVADLDRILPRK